MATNGSVPYNGGFLPDIILQTLRYYHWETRLDPMESSCPYRQCSHLNVLIISSLTGWVFRRST